MINMINTIKEFVEKDRIKEALELMKDIDRDMAITLLGRFNAAKRDNIAGTLSPTKFITEKAKIRQAIIDHLNLYDSGITVLKADPAKEAALDASEVSFIGCPLSEGNLLAFIEQNARKDEGLIVEADTLLTDLRAYYSFKSKQKLYDISNRVFSNLDIRWKNLVETKATLDISKFESFVEQVNNLLMETYPSNEDLNEAYDLLKINGIVNKNIENLLNSEYEGVRAACASLIERELIKLSDKVYG